ncbi:MAG TPA: MarR family transcriptional regulator [Bacteroidia bacterium]|nr:MarR family transcriptional regulator [Sphingobacteriales bacterium]HPD65255.1 MarR family transcriptional regulator [Bacteroidia bacterium]HRS58634.1 MarR family transcriptional regulator [Bacteroidia bacterium]HRU67841.1 MarR family transcriptional regulator [Bacteroidia bacterium]
MDAKEIVFQTLKKSEKPLKPGEIASLAGIERADVDKAIKVLKKEEKIFSPKACFYQAK